VSALPVGTSIMVRLGVRRERLPLLCWVIGIGAVVATTFPAIARLYPDAAGRAALAAGIGANPATTAITGPVFADGIGGLSAWRIGVLGATATALMAIVTVVRRTRSDEETGRAELLAAGALGRSAPLVAALALAGGCCLLVAVLTVAGAVGTAGGAGGVVLALALAGTGAVFAGVAAVAAQLTGSTRAATAFAGVVLAVSFLVRAAGDVLVGAGWLRWLSPLGWVEQARPYAGDHAVVLLLYPAATAALVALAIRLLHRRDLGGGLRPARPGPAGSAALRGPATLSLRVQRAGIVGWAVGFAIAGAVLGGVAADAPSLLAGNADVQRIFAELGGGGSLSDTFLAGTAGILGLLATAQGIAAVLRLRTEEQQGRAELLLGGATSRLRVFGAALLPAVAGPALSLAAAGLTAGLAPGGAGLSSGLPAMLVQLPAAWTVIAVAAALVGAAPTVAPAAWGVLGLCLVLGQVGSILQLPRAVQDLSPFRHLPQLPAQDLRWLPVLILLAAAVLLTAAGAAGWRRRDIG
jgi:ABC-2 type transport system permease protein